MFELEHQGKCSFRPPLPNDARTERHRLRVLQVDVDSRRDVAQKLGVASAPTLVLVRKRRAVARIEGRASAPRIERMLGEHLEPFNRAAATAP